MSLFHIFLALFLAGTIAVGLLGWWCISFALWPDQVRRSALAIEERGLWRLVLWGLVPSVLLIVVGGLLAKAGPLAAVSLFLVAFGFYLAHRGSAGLAYLVGAQISASDASEGRQVYRGGLALCGAIAFPILGWIGMGLFVTLVGFGLWLTGFLERRSRRKTRASLDGGGGVADEPS